jgi:hypothetical protein
MSNRAVSVCLGVILTLSQLSAPPAMAYKFPGEGPSPAGAIAAKAIGQQCPGILSPAEIEELDAYLAKDASETARIEAEKRKDPAYRPFPNEEFRKNLTEDYEKKYRDPRNCDADAAEEARDMLQRVRKAMASGMPLYPADSKPDVGEATIAKVTAEKCPGAMTALELAELELYLAKYWVSFAKTATDADALATMQQFKKAGNDIASGWKSADCSAEAVAKAKSVAARMPKSD